MKANWGWQAGSAGRDTSRGSQQGGGGLHGQGKGLDIVGKRVLGKRVCGGGSRGMGIIHGRITRI